MDLKNAWLRKSPTCWRHVATTAKCQHILPKCPCRGDTILIPTPFFVSGFAGIHQIFLYSIRGTYGEFLCKIWLKYLFDIRSPWTFLLLSTSKFKIFAASRALSTFKAASIEQHLLPQHKLRNNIEPAHPYQFF
jgi:hypothetical protein